MELAFHPNFFDTRGLLRPWRHTEWGEDEILDAFNGELYTAYLITLLKKLGYVNEAKSFTEKIKTAYVKDKSYSHDDTTGLVCSGIRPVFHLSRYWYRTELILYTFFRFHFSPFILAPFWAVSMMIPLYVKMIFSCWNQTKTVHGEIETDGKLIAWLICESFPILFFPVKWICYLGIKKHFGEDWLSKLMNIKFNRDADHPCRLMAAEYDNLF